MDSDNNFNYTYGVSDNLRIDTSSMKKVFPSCNVCGRKNLVLYSWRIDMLAYAYFSATIRLKCECGINYCVEIPVRTLKEAHELIERENING